jgi:uncharacterized protein with von Willebrand factor type A (vWA) domain
MDSVVLAKVVVDLRRTRDQVGQKVIKSQSPKHASSERVRDNVKKQTSFFAYHCQWDEQ